MLTRSIEYLQRRSLRSANIARISLRTAIRKEVRKYGTLENNFSSPLVSANALIQDLEDARSGREICHVIGSGASLSETYSIIDPESDALFTCNFGGLIDLPFDLYSVEIGTTRSAMYDISRCQADLIEKVATDRTKIIVKNVWEGKVEDGFLRENYQVPLTVVKDVLLPDRIARNILQAGNDYVVAAEILRRPENYIVQFISSVLTLISIAYFSGYSRIVVHGLDGAGPHFFHKSESKRLASISNQARILIPAPVQSKLHIAGSPARIFFPHFKIRLSQVGVDLSHASELVR